MELNKYQYNNNDSSSGANEKERVIQVRAIITCPTCQYEKRFLNRFHRSELEMLTVALKVFDWLVCNDCGELLDLNLEFNI
jgi:hypothetical protein